MSPSPIDDLAEFNAALEADPSLIDEFEADSLDGLTDDDDEGEVAS